VQGTRRALHQRSGRTACRGDPRSQTQM